MADTDTIDAPPVSGTPVMPEISPRDSIRAAILNASAEDELVSIYGQTVAVRTPALEDLLQYRDAQNDDYSMARAIANNVYMPGTDERVFTDADVEVLMKAKFTPDMKRLNKAIMKALGADEALDKKIEDNTKSSKE
jgi:hypothetical protein